MIVVIQCAATKRSSAAYFRNGRGQKVCFVGDPAKAPLVADTVFVRPDDPTEEGPTWRECVRRYNETRNDNLFGLLPAIGLYQHPVYLRLAEAFGSRNVFILSAGWGLISANFLTPFYDITFSASADIYKRRKRADRYNDFCMLADNAQPICFVGGKDYLPLFVTLTQKMHAPRTVIYNSAVPPDAPGCTLERFHTSTRTNWHYECAARLASVLTENRSTSSLATGPNPNAEIKRRRKP